MKSIMLAVLATLLLAACGAKTYTAVGNIPDGEAKGEMVVRGDDVEIRVTFPNDAEPLVLKSKREKVEQGFNTGEGKHRYAFQTVYLGKKNDEALRCEFCSFSKGDKGVLLELWKPKLPE